MFDFLSSFILQMQKTSVKLFLSLPTKKLYRRKYITACWSTMLKSSSLSFPFTSAENLRMMYEEKSVSHEKALKLLSAQPRSDAERESFDHLKRFLALFSFFAIYYWVRHHNL